MSATEEFFVAGREPGQAFAVIVADDRSDVKKFFRQYAGCNILKVGRDDMEKMTSAYIKSRADKTT